MDSGQGLPREIMESLRIRIALLGSYHTEMQVFNIHSHHHSN